MKLFQLLFIISILCVIPHLSKAQSFYLGKSKEFIIQEKGTDFRTDFKANQTILTYKIVSQKGEESLVLYYFNNKNKCIIIVKDEPMWWIIPWTDELSSKYKRIDQHNWLEKNNIIHAVSVINENKWLYIIKYKD